MNSFTHSLIHLCSLSTVWGAGHRGKQITPCCQYLAFWSPNHSAPRAPRRALTKHRTFSHHSQPCHIPTAPSLWLCRGHTPLLSPHLAVGSPVSGLEYSRHSTSASWASILTSSSMKCNSWILGDITCLLYSAQRASPSPLPPEVPCHCQVGHMGNTLPWPTSLEMPNHTYHLKPALLKEAVANMGVPQ